MPSITLDDIAAAADAKYGPFVVEGVPGGDVTLLNPIRLSKDKRGKLMDLQKVTEGDDLAAQSEALRDIIRLAAKTKAEGDRLLRAFGDDDAKLAILLNKWGEGAQQGEA